MVSSYLERDAVTADDKISIDDVGLRFAFGIEGYVDGKLRDDPNFVRWLVRNIGKDSEGND